MSIVCQMEFHPLADIFPMMSVEELTALRIDIATQGLREPLVLAEGKIVDGRNRYNACVELGIEPCYRDWDGVGSLLDFIISMNLHRRHLNETQRAGVAAKIANMQLGDNRGAHRPKEGSANLQTLIEDKISIPQAAEMLNVSERTVATYRSVAAAMPELIEKMDNGEITAHAAKRKVERRLREQTKKAELEESIRSGGSAFVETGDALEWLKQQEPCDLLLTDPPYATDVEDIVVFAASWLPLALSKVKRTGRAYIFIGSYPQELLAYLQVALPKQVLVWTYRNAIGPKPKYDYKQNWQAILYYRFDDAQCLHEEELNALFSVQDVAAPDGRLDGRLDVWEKPAVLAERIVLQATETGHTVLDPFAGTGTFLLAAARLGRIAKGCDIDPDKVHLMISRGCRG